MNRFLIASMLLFGSTVADASLAQTRLLNPESAVGGVTVDPDDHHCYYIQTEPGEQYRVVGRSDVFYVRLALGRGADCETMSVDVRADEGFFRAEARLDFSAGGGGYLLRIENFRDLSVGQYTLTLNRQDGLATSSLLPMGDSTPPPAWIVRPQLPDGTASTRATSAASTFQPGQVLRDCPACPEMVVLPAGSFMMGSNHEDEGHSVSEGPRRLVTFSDQFAVARYEVSFDEWDACVADWGCTAQPGDEGWGRGTRPAINVSWADAMQYVSWLSHATGERYHLLSEAEWEYAARAGTSTPWNTGVAIIADDANFLGTWKRTVPVSGFPANGFDLHNMHGNVHEWVQDCWEEGYFEAPVDGSAFTTAICEGRIIRGGSFASSANAVRSAARSRFVADHRAKDVGFRVARSL